MVALLQVDCQSLCSGILQERAVVVNVNVGANNVKDNISLSVYCCTVHVCVCV